MADIKIDIPEGQINNAIAVAIAESLSPERRDGLIRDIVRAHLSYKANSYDKETMLSKEVGSTIRSMASEHLKVKLEELRPDVEAMVDKAIGPAFRKSVFSELEASLRTITIRNLRITAILDDLDQ